MLSLTSTDCRYLELFGRQPGTNPDSQNGDELVDLWASEPWLHCQSLSHKICYWRHIGDWPNIGVLASSLSLTPDARRILEINENRLDRQRSYRATPKRLMGPAKHRCFLLLMAKYWFTSAMTSHYNSTGRWVMHDGMRYGRIEGQGQGHEPFKVWIPSIFNIYLRHLQRQLANDY